MQHNQQIAELGPLLVAGGIREVIICPGSRNAPLMQLFTSNKMFRCHSIVDERSAGYVALGMSRQLKQPVVVVTTSGTAVMNLTPAVAEAHLQRIPLIIITADRPLESIPQFNNQVTDQFEPFKKNAKAFLELPFEVHEQEDLKLLCTDISRLIRSSQVFPAGPVHMNVILREPLYEPLPEPLISISLVEEPVRATRFHELESGHFPPRRRILIVAGMQAPDDKILFLLQELICRRLTVVVAENIANMPSSEFVSNPELLLLGASEDERGELVPDVVFVFGGQVVSKSLKLFIQGLEGVAVTDIEENAGDVLENLFGSDATTIPGFVNSYLSQWKEVERRSLARAGRFLDKAEFCNLTSIRTILNAVPAGSVLHLGNSSTIRYSQMLPSRRDLSYFSNRGISGIDGSVSSAVGAAIVSMELHVLVVGDLSFVYDSNAMWNKDFPDNLRIVVMNDAGGGIFRLLEGPDRMEFFEEFAVTHHPVSLELISQAFGRGFCRAGTMRELEKISGRIFQQGSGYSILEVDTSDSENSTIFNEFKKSIS